MGKMKGKGESVSCVDCNVKKSMGGGEFEVIASKKSKVMKSPKKFKVEHTVETNEMADITGIEGVSVYRKVSIKGKMIRVGGGGVNVNGKEVQETGVCD